MRPGYKLTDVGIIPEEWELKPLKQISPRQSVGLVINPSTYYEKAGTIPLLVGSNVSENCIDATTADRISIASNELLSASRLSAGDLVTVRVGEPGVTAVVPEELDGCNCASMMIVRRHPSFESHWLSYMMNSRLGRQQVEHVQYGTAQKQFNISDAVNFRYPVPPRPEQCAITAVLSDVDTLLSALDRLTAKKLDLKQAAVQQLTTGQTRLPGFHGEWRQRRFGDLLKYERPDKYVVSSPDYLDSGRIPVLTANKSFILGYTNDECGIYDDLPAIIFDDFTTDSKYVDFPFKVKSSAIKILKTRNPETNLGFLFERMSLVRFPLGDHKRYYISEYQHLEVPTPEPNEQAAIATVLSDMDAELKTLERRSEKTRALKQAITQELLTGRTRLVSPQKVYA